jgi:hypothetical protein
MLRFAVLLVVLIAITRLNVSAWLGLGILLVVYVGLAIAQYSLRRRRSARDSS